MKTKRIITTIVISWLCFLLVIYIQNQFGYFVEYNYIKPSINLENVVENQTAVKYRNCPFQPPSITSQHNTGWLYTEQFIANQHVPFNRQLGLKMIEYIGNCTMYDIGAGVGQFGNLIESERANIEYNGFDGGNNIESFCGKVIKLRGQHNFLVPKILCWIDAGIPIKLDKKDWVLSIEVGEHIEKSKESVFLDNLVTLSTKGVILSWAVKGQRGYQHINCQNNNYIIGEMKIRGMEYNEQISNLLRKVVHMSGINMWLQNTIMIFHHTQK